MSLAYIYLHINTVTKIQLVICFQDNNIWYFRFTKNECNLPDEARDAYPQQLPGLKPQSKLSALHLDFPH